jgi:hypothetical protein
MKVQHIILVKALNQLIDLYNIETLNLNFTEVRDFQNFIEAQGVDIEAVNNFINTEK